MSKFFEKLGRKGVKKSYLIGSGILLALLVAFAMAYKYTSWNWLLGVSIVTIIITWFIMTVIYIVIAWGWQIKDLMNECKNQNNILSGGLAVLVLFAFPFFIVQIFSKIEFNAPIKGILDGISTLIITAIPAFIALLGVQYTVAIQE